MMIKRLSSGLKRLLLPALLALLVTHLSDHATAQVYLEDLDNPLQVSLQTPLSSTRSLAGERFTAVLPETHCMHEYCLEKGTIFSGSVVDSQESRRFRNKGYVALKVDKVVYPSGEEVTLNYDIKPKAEKVVGEEQMYYKEMRKRNRIVYVPIKALILVNPAAGIVTRVATGAALGLKDERMKDESMSKRLVGGLYNSSMTSEVVDVARKKESNYNVGDRIYINIPEQTLAEIFRIPSQVYEGME